MGLFGFGKKQDPQPTNDTQVQQENKDNNSNNKETIISDNISKIEITISDVPNTNIIKVKFDGQIDESDIDEAFTKLKEKIGQAPNNTRYIFDFEKLRYINSMGLGQLSEVHMMIMERNGDIIIIKSNPNILEILKYVRLDTVITFADSEEEALTIYKNQ